MGLDLVVTRSSPDSCRQFNLFIKESQDVIRAAGITELCELLDVEPKA